MTEFLDNGAEVRSIRVIREMGRFSFEAGPLLRESIFDFLKPEATAKLEEKPFTLTSDYVHEVVRRNGTLRGEDAKMEVAIHGLLEKNDKRPLPLARILETKQFSLEGISYMTLRTGVYISPELISFMQDHPEIPQEYRQGLSIPVHTAGIPLTSLRQGAGEYYEQFRGKVFGNNVKTQDPSLNAPAVDNRINVGSMDFTLHEQNVTDK